MHVVLPSQSSVRYTFVVMKVTYMDFYGSYVTLLSCQYDVNTLHFDLYSSQVKINKNFQCKL